jgi:hypothetical protein
MVLVLQWILLSLITLQVLHQHGDFTAEEAREFGYQFEIANILMIVFIFLALFILPVIRALPDIYRAARRKAGAYL